MRRPTARLIRGQARRLNTAVAIALALAQWLAAGIHQGHDRPTDPASDRHAGRCVLAGACPCGDSHQAPRPRDGSPCTCPSCHYLAGVKAVGWSIPPATAEAFLHTQPSPRAPSPTPCQPVAVRSRAPPTTPSAV